MPENLRLAVILFLICAISAGILAQVYQITASRIKVNAEQEEIAKRDQVLPEAVSFQLQEKNSLKYYRGIDADGREVGISLSVSIRGYGGPIVMMVGIDREGKITGVAISPLDHTETPGLGAKISQGNFLSQFEGKSLPEIKLSREGGRIDAIAGATISSRAVGEGVKKALEFWQNLEEENIKSESLPEVKSGEGGDYIDATSGASIRSEP